MHKEVGFAKVKCYSAGKLDESILNLNKTKTTFTKVIETYDDQGKTYIVSEYSNDGTLFSYVNRLKANSIALKEDQIEFFFFSLFEPLKVIQDSPIKSLCMLSIKNIYIENGIPKIGEPVPSTRRSRTNCGINPRCLTSTIEISNATQITKTAPMTHTPWESSSIS